MLKVREQSQRYAKIISRDKIDLNSVQTTSDIPITGCHVHSFKVCLAVSLLAYHDLFSHVLEERVKGKFNSCGDVTFCVALGTIATIRWGLHCGGGGGGRSGGNFCLIGYSME